MILKHKIENVKKILLVNKRIFTQSSHKNDEIEGIHVSDDYYLFNDLQTVYRYRQSILEVFRDNYDDFVEINTDSNDLRQNLSNENKILLFYLSSDDIAIYDLNSRKTIETISFDKDISVYVKNGVIVTEGKSYTIKNIISYWSLKNISESLWKHTLPEGFKIVGSVQVIDNVLFFIAYKDNHYQLVTGLDIETGTILYQNQYEVTNENNFVVAKNLNEEDKLMYGYGHVYQVLNPKTGEIILQKEFKENKEYDLLPSINSIYDNKLWFVSRRGKEAKFGAIDLETSEIDFVQSFPLENDGQFDKPVFHQGKIYLHDSNNVLYVLE
ncbi:PQQ-binding-like beta-propeller repeat protein [Paenimyroides aestuarii]|uniref:Uncharacterized protein n=1 Tax=Paenimyroides aestuarii TaxID=2968490 RepID=A0ABY5NWB8_9FLAO|nr:hypothetical protein [Paenimyroides aestuarii]UUV22729.1 hypothetical protein NPX36_06725 [Paenimyroides aestuarii]